MSGQPLCCWRAGSWHETWRDLQTEALLKHAAEFGFRLQFQSYKGPGGGVAVFKV